MYTSIPIRASFVLEEQQYARYYLIRSRSPLANGNDPIRNLHLSQTEYWCDRVVYQYIGRD